MFSIKCTKLFKRTLEYFTSIIQHLPFTAIFVMQLFQQISRLYTTERGNQNAFSFLINTPEIYFSHSNAC